jgi:type VI secretion system protein ImpF
MAKTDVETIVQPSLIDRLIDNEPGLRADPPITRAQSLRRFKAALRRDLEWLLNTTRMVVNVPPQFRQVENSLMTYGLPDLTSMSLNSAQDERRLLQALETTIARFEPRMTRVKVTPIGRLTKKAVTLQFQVEGVLLIDPAPEHITFDTVLEVSRGSYAVKGDQGA